MPANTSRRLIAASLVLATLVQSADAGADKPPAEEAHMFVHPGSIRMFNPQPEPPRFQPQSRKNLTPLAVPSARPQNDGGASSPVIKKLDDTRNAVIGKV